MPTAKPAPTVTRAALTLMPSTETTALFCTSSSHAVAVRDTSRMLKGWPLVDSTPDWRHGGAAKATGYVQVTRPLLLVVFTVDCGMLSASAAICVVCVDSKAVWSASAAVCVASTDVCVAIVLVMPMSAVRMSAMFWLLASTVAWRMPSCPMVSDCHASRTLTRSSRSLAAASTAARHAISSGVSASVPAPPICARAMSEKRVDVMSPSIVGKVTRCHSSSGLQPERLSYCCGSVSGAPQYFNSAALRAAMASSMLVKRPRLYDLPATFMPALHTLYILFQYTPT